ncbi:MAG: PqqD family protein [Lachnospiraceae bacterium]|nr:PqqD family protein [Lachnospiraceae bacterium]
MNQESVLARNSKLIIDRVDDEVIVFNEETQNTHILNEIAGYILENSDNITVEQVIDKLYSNISCNDLTLYSKEEITNDCIAFIQEMFDQGLVYIN